MTFTLVAEGSSDEVLMPILEWSFRVRGVSPVIAQWADFSRMPRRGSLNERVESAIDLYPCDLLFVHLDADSHDPELRRTVIEEAVRPLQIRHVPVVPIRMTEAWLLADEAAIRSAAGNPNGTEVLNLPHVRRLEHVVDPKQALAAALTNASGLNARRRARFPVAQRVRLVAHYINDYSHLRSLSAFQLLQRDLDEILAHM